MRVLFLAAEAAPLIKVGGLGDVAGSLPKALRELDPQLELRLVIPFHGVLREQELQLEKVSLFRLNTPGKTFNVEIYMTQTSLGEIYLVGGDGIDITAPVYQSDPALDAEKYCYFSLASLEFCVQEQWPPDIVHANDWHTAFALKALRDRFPEHIQFECTKGVLTIHNLPYQGQGAQGVLPQFGLSAAEDSRLPEWSRGFPLSLGLECADRITTVSPHYAEEIQSPEFGAGLDGYFRGLRPAVKGVLNGIDHDEWNPALDKEVKQPFSSRNIGQRAENKRELQNELGFAANNAIPLIAMVGRVDVQKGVDIAVAALERSVHLPWRAVILGTGDPELEELLSAFAARHAQQVRCILSYDRSLAHRIYAGADMILIPSRYEPCGLTQLIGMRYGCIPVATAVGGLVDTITDERVYPGRGTGFLADHQNAEGFSRVLHHALGAFGERGTWRKIQARAMRRDNSWSRSAKEYLELYTSLQPQTNAGKTGEEKN